MKSKIRLLPLTPEFDREQHQVYVDAIEDALSSEKAIKNIALTGGYGVGKSSVLKQVAEEHKGKSLQISLSTLGLPDGDGGGDKSDETPTGRIQPTNRIQKEIVKQLVYGEEPYKMPGSRFRRIAKFKPWRALGAAVPGGIALALVFYLAGWTNSLATLFRANGLGLWFQLIVLVVFTAGVEALLALSHNRLTIKGLKVVSTEIALGEKDTTYFDKFLDEIVYVFQVTDYDILIFEDIDRFDDPHIFETLRALNILLNGAKQLDGRKIRFIYAIKDSIFEQLGQRAASEEGISDGVDSFTGDLIIDEVARANRTKFFDIVIPVVPFITHTNARDLATRVLKDVTPAISSELIDLAARHLPDMRLIKNVHNEFLIFRSKIFGAGVDLSQDELFAMMLYKNTHLLDFELIRTGRSKLDDLYRGSVELRRINLERLGREATELRQQLSKIDSVASRSKSLGAALVAYIDDVLVSLGANQPQQWQITLQGALHDRAAIQSDAFWQSVAVAPASEPLTVPIALPTGYRGNFAIDKEWLKTHLNDSLAKSEWDSNEKLKLEQELAANQGDQELLLRASFETLYSEVRFQDSQKRTFSDLVASLKSELARQLVASGFLSRNFVLYTSTYYGELVSAHARNFLIQNLERGVMDVDYELSDSDVDALIKERGEGVLHEKSFYNVSVLDHLLESDKPRAAVLVKSLQAMTESAQRFVGAYIASGKKLDELVLTMAASWSGTLMFVVGRDDLDETRKVSLLNAAMLNATSIKNFAPDDNFREFVTIHVSEFESLSAAATSTKQAQVIGAILNRASVRLPVLNKLSPTVCKAVVAANCYRITIDNLKAAIDSSDLALDQLRASRQATYDYVLENLGEYLDAIEGGKVMKAISTMDGLYGVLTDVVDKHPELIDRLLDDAQIDSGSVELHNTPIPFWPALADHDAFPLTFENVRAYIQEVGEIDISLGRYLSKVRVVSVADDVAQADRQTLALELLSAESTIPDPGQRVDLVKSLELENYLQPTSIPSESGNLIGLLIGSEKLEDNAASYSLTLAHDWTTKESAILASKEFVRFMNPAQIPVSDVPNVLRSTKIASAIKDALIERFDEFIPTDDTEALKAAAEYAVATKKKLSFDKVSRISAANVGQDLTSNVLALGLLGITADQLTQLAGDFGSWLKKLLARDGTRPKIENTEANKTIAEHLKELDQVSSIEDKGREVQVNLKKS